MNVLIVSATELEIKSLLSQSQNPNLDIIISGIGMVNTSYSLTKQLLKKNYDLVINLGIAGCMDRSIALGQVVRVVADRFADLGIRDQEDIFHNPFDLGWSEPNSSPFESGRLVEDCSFSTPDIPSKDGITKNTATGSQREIDELIKSFGMSFVESMEGASFFQVCKMEKIQCLQLRAISNYIEERNTSNWKKELAINNLNAYVSSLINRICPSLS